MGMTKECLYCVSEITDGFKFNGDTDMRVWEKSLSLSLCDAGVSPVKIGSMILELRFIIFIHKVSKELGLSPGQCVTNPSVVEFIQKLFREKLLPEETAKRAKSQFPTFPWQPGDILSGASSTEDGDSFYI